MEHKTTGATNNHSDRFILATPSVNDWNIGAGDRPGEHLEVFLMWVMLPDFR